MMFFRSDPQTWVLNLISIVLLITVLGSQMGFLDFGNNIGMDSEDYQTVKYFATACQMQHENWKDTQAEIRELKDTDLFRAYTECREDFRDLRGNIDLKWFLTIFIFIIILYWTWYFTREYYKDKLKSKKVRKK